MNLKINAFNNRPDNLFMINDNPEKFNFRDLKCCDSTSLKTFRYKKHFRY